MKTLDEVIKGMECCYIHQEEPNCSECPYKFKEKYGLCGDQKLDALQWLKGYKAHIELDRLRDKCEAENEPLTWQELRQMEGKPVWVEIGDGSKGWVIIRKITDTGIVSGSDGFIGIGTAYGMDTTWQAYRRERTNED